ncbi:transposase [Actinacidiphila cocklensis]|uniref:Transposase n=1 Tax=Actinacidiphila cocklensis TaxID=887465 RepID=A0A9W4DL61_9ACTN|nr:transposase [Actinacidiphila cocklensis]
MIYCGIDWAERTHDVALVDDTGQLLAKRHITDDAAGYRNLMDLLAEYGDTEETPIPVAIETSRGLLVAVLRAGKRKVFAINPMAAARYRDRHAVSRKKSDPGDALVLANILRTDMHAHRPLPNDSDLARAIAVLARAQQDAVWNRQQVANQLRSLLREYYPAALDAFAKWDNGLCRPEARELMKLAPTPAKAASLTRTQITAALKRAGRKRGIESDVERLREAFRTDCARQPELVEDALGKQTLALLGQLTAACTAADLAQGCRGGVPATPRLRNYPQLPRPRYPACRAGAGRNRRRPHPLRGRPRPEGLRGRLTRHPGLRQEVQRHQTMGEERPAQPRRLPLGVLSNHCLARCQSPLPAAT